MMARYYFPDVFQSLDDERYFVKANVAGISHRQEAASCCVEGQPLQLIRDVNNKHDRKAIRVLAEELDIGFVPRDINAAFAEYLDHVGELEAEIEAVVGGTENKPTIGIVMRIYLPDDVSMEFD